jgi:hypothetical protein
MATTTNDVQLDQLEGELSAAGIDVTTGIGSHETGGSTAIYTYDNDGHIVDLPNAAQTVVDAHVAVTPVDPRIAVIDGMDLSDADKQALKDILL